MSLVWNIVLLVASVASLFLNYLNYHTYVDRNDLDITKSQKILSMGRTNGIINAVITILILNLVRLVG